MTGRFGLPRTGYVPAWADGFLGTSRPGSPRSIACLLPFGAPLAVGRETMRRVVDHLTAAGRSRVMAAIRSTDTGPERALRAALRAAGATGYRLHLRSLPGKPDVAFTRWRVAVFVDGAFWHGHPDHFNAESASEYWQAKIARTQERDRAATAGLGSAGWRVVRLWDFELKDDPASVLEKVLGALRDAGWPG